MSGRCAKHLRRTIYGADVSPRQRWYQKTPTGTILADVRRQLYQRAKRAYTEKAQP